MKRITSLFASFIVFFSAYVMANVSMDMFKMNREIGTLLNAENAETFAESANTFLAAAKKAQETMPRSLVKEPEKFEGYQKGMQEVIDLVNQAKRLAQEGKLTEAKQTASQLNQLKKYYHSEYK